MHGGARCGGEGGERVCASAVRCGYLCAGWCSADGEKTSQSNHASETSAPAHSGSRSELAPPAPCISCSASPS